MTAQVAAKDFVTRPEVEDFLYHEAALLDEWRLDAWQELLADDGLEVRYSTLTRWVREADLRGPPRRARPAPLGARRGDG